MTSRSLDGVGPDDEPWTAGTITINGRTYAYRAVTQWPVETATRICPVFKTRASTSGSGLTSRNLEIKPRQSLPDEVITFYQTGDFEACRAAEKWCADKGYSVGRMQGPQPRGLLYGSYDIQKWRNLRSDDRAALHGLMTGSMRNGPVIIRIYRQEP